MIPLFPSLSAYIRSGYYETATARGYYDPGALSTSYGRKIGLRDRLVFRAARFDVSSEASGVGTSFRANRTSISGVAVSVGVQLFYVRQESCCLAARSAAVPPE